MFWAIIRKITHFIWKLPFLQPWNIAVYCTCLRNGNSTHIWVKHNIAHLSVLKLVERLKCQSVLRKILFQTQRRHSTKFYGPFHGWNLRFALGKQNMVLISSAITVQMISEFVFVRKKVKFLYCLDPKFQVCCDLLWLRTPVCVGSGWQFHEDGLSHDAAHVDNFLKLLKTIPH